MSTHVYQVAGGWHAEDDILVMACYGRDPEEASAALDLARARAREIAARWAALPESDEELTAEDLYDISAAREEIAHGDFQRVTV